MPRLQKFTRKVTCNRTRPAYYLQLDIKNFWLFEISRDETGVLKRSFSRICPCEAFSERANTATPGGVSARLAGRFACRHARKLRFSTPDSSLATDHGNSQRANIFTICVLSMPIFDGDIIRCSSFFRWGIVMSFMANRR